MTCGLQLHGCMLCSKCENLYLGDGLNEQKLRINNATKSVN